jgi:hypothetical protein
MMGVEGGMPLNPGMMMAPIIMPAGELWEGQGFRVKHCASGWKRSG